MTSYEHHWQGNYLSVEMTDDCVYACSHQGECYYDCESYLQTDEFKIHGKAERIREELSEYGAWDEEQLKDEKENVIRLIWIVAGNIQDELVMDE